jgi:hypothetical protein
MYGLVRFDPAVIAGQTIRGATLTLYLRTILGPGNITIHPILSSWSEGTVTWALQPPSETTAAASFDVTTAFAGSKVTVDVTNVVQRWANGTLAHAGLLLKSPTAKKAYFDSKEFSGGFAATLIVTTEEGPPSPRILDLSTPDGCVIDEPGEYVLDRDWYFTPPSADLDQEPNARCGSVFIRSEGVSLDMRGFKLEGGTMWADNPLVTIDTAGSVSLRNGVIFGKETSIRATVPASQPWVSIGLSKISCVGGVELGNRRVSVDGGSFQSGSGAYNALTVGSGSNVRFARFSCYESVCFYTQGSRVEFVQNEVTGSFAPGVVISGANAFVAENVIRVSGAPAGAILVGGTRNILARNYVSDTGLEGSGTGILGIRVEGTGIVLDGNIVTQMSTGISFSQTGHFYGSNRVSAATPFVGTDGQTDWGGNVGF